MSCNSLFCDCWFSSLFTWSRRSSDTWRPTEATRASSIAGSGPPIGRSSAPNHWQGGLECGLNLPFVFFVLIEVETLEVGRQFRNCVENLGNRNVLGLRHHRHVCAGVGGPDARALGPAAAHMRATAARYPGRRRSRHASSQIASRTVLWVVLHVSSRPWVVK